MGRPKSNNPKTKYIGIVTTPEKYSRFKSLGLIGDQAIDVLLYHLENDKTRLNIQKMQVITDIKKINDEIEQLEFRKLELETKLEELNSKIGFNKENGLRKDINNAISNVLQRYNKVKDIYNIHDFMDLNEDYLEAQSYLANISLDELKELICENI